MAFDITPYIHQTPAQVRAAIRRGEIDFPTAGMCAGYAQANLVILPPEYAADFEEYTRLNPFPCPVLEIVKGSPITHAMGEGASLVTDIPRYRVYENGVFTKELTDASAYWKEGYVGFLIGCSFSFEEALLAAGISTHLALQTFLNIGVVTNFLPATGISLPFFSYGGTALLLQLFEMGVVLAVSRQCDNKLL